jgi:hypothetical protein
VQSYPAPPSLPLLTPISQCHKGYIYASAHVHCVDRQLLYWDGRFPVGIDAGFEVAPGDASDVEVANAHDWGSYCLVFSDGAYAHSHLDIANRPYLKGIAFNFGK